MTDVTTAAPVPGWYDDPTGAAPYRWWDGQRWTPQTVDAPPRAPVAQAPAPAPHTPTSAPAQPASTFPTEAATPAQPTAPAPASPHISPSADGSFPSRRSIREAASPDAGPTIPASPARPATPESAEATTGISPDGSAIVPAYTPINPLVPLSVTEPETVQDATTGFDPAAAGFHAPATWVANAPAAPAPPAAPFGFGATPVGYGLGTGASSYGMVTAADRRNRPARLSLTLALLVIVGTPVINAVRASATPSTATTLVFGLLGIAAIGSVIAVIPLGIIGIVRARAMKRSGIPPRGLPHAITGLAISALIIGSVVVAIPVVLAQAHAASAAEAPVATAPSTAIPQVGTQQDDNGTTTYVYSESATEAFIKQAIISKTHLTPSSVSCPAQEPLTIGTTFDCTVNLATGPLTAHLTVLSEQGEIEIMSIG